ncbi:hypothetical protein Tco_0720761 [Tanacetum coccineum]
MLQPHFADNTLLTQDRALMDNLSENLTSTLALLTPIIQNIPSQTSNQLEHPSNTRTKPQFRRQGCSLNVQDERRESRVAIARGTGGQDNIFDEDVDEQPVQDLELNVDNVFQADDCDAFDSDVDEAPTAQTMYGKGQRIAIVQSNVSSVPNDAYMMILNEMHEMSAQCGSVTTENNVVDKSLAAKLATYKEQVELYERRVKFELTEREQNIDEQLRIVIADQEVTSLKKDFKQKENKYLEEFLDMKALKEKVEDRLFKQDQSLQTVHMLCKPKPHYDEQKKVTIGYKNPLYLTRVKQVQPALYNGYEITKTYHVPAIVHDSEDTIEIAENTRKQMNEKIKDPECVKKKVKIAPHDYSKENYLATFTSQKQLTPEQIFWSKDLLKMQAEALKEQTTASRSIKALTLYPPNTPATLVPMALTKEMKEIFKELKAEVDKIVMNKKCDEIERKDIPMANDALISDCLSKEVFYIATNSELTVSRFIEMHDAHTIVQARCLELKAKLSKLKDKIQKDDHNGLVKVNSFANASGSNLRSNTKKNRISPAKSVHKKKVEEHPRTNKSSLQTTNRVDSSVSSSVLTVKKVWKPKQVKQVWKATGKLLTNVGYQWKPTGRKFTLGEQCPLTRLTKSKVVPAKQTENVSTSKIVITEQISHTSQKPLTRYQCRTKQYKAIPTSIPTPTKNEAIDASLHSTVASANQQEPNKN